MARYDITQHVPSFRLYADPGHAWLRVPFDAIVDVGIQGKISGYSYQSAALAGDTSGPKGELSVYLEEDCDMGLFMEAFKAKYGVLPGIMDMPQDGGFIRRFKRYEVKA